MYQISSNYIKRADSLLSFELNVEVEFYYSSNLIEFVSFGLHFIQQYFPTTNELSIT